VDKLSLTEKEQQALYRQVLGMAFTMTGTREAAEELTHQAFLLLYSTRPWRDDGPTLAQHMWGVLRSTRSNQREAKLARLRAEGRYLTESDLSSEQGRSAETVSLADAQRKKEEEQARADLATLRTRLADKPLDLRIIDLMFEGITKREHLVERTGEPMEAVKHSLARIRRTMNSIVAERGQNEDE
jgi:DNA-directed RNA polymerase specialized sigma24 family protein